MSEAVSEPATVENPVLPNNFDAAKAVFKQARVAEGLDKPSEPEPSAATEETPPETKTDVEQAEPPTSVLPDDIFAPAPTEEPKQSDAIAAIDAMVLPKGAKEKTQADFGKLKTVAKEQISKAEARVRELEDKVSKSTSSVEIEALQKKITETEKKASTIEEEFARVAFEHSPRFQAQFVTSEKAAIDSAKSYLEGSEIDPKIIDFAAHNTGKNRLQILSDSGMDERMVAAVTSHLAEYDRVQREKSTAIENWRNQGAQWQEQEQKRIETETVKRREFENKTWETVLAKNSTDLLPFRSSKNETWNSRAETLKLQAKENFERTFNGQGVPLEVSADAYQKAAAYDALMDNVVNPLMEKTKLLETENAKLRSAAPGGSITQSNGTVTKPDPTKMDRVDLSKQTFNEQMAAVRR